MKFLKELFAIERNPMKGLMAVEWAAMGYLVLTLVPKYDRHPFRVHYDMG